MLIYLTHKMHATAKLTIIVDPISFSAVPKNDVLIILLILYLLTSHINTSATKAKFGERKFSMEMSLG